MIDIKQFIKNNKLSIIVKPNSKKNEVIGWDKDRKALKINISAEPENNKANVEIIKFFSKLFKKDIKIISGLTSKKKVLKIS